MDGRGRPTETVDGLGKQTSLSVSLSPFSPSLTVSHLREETDQLQEKLVVICFCWRVRGQERISCRRLCITLNVCMLNLPMRSLESEVYLYFITTYTIFVFCSFIDSWVKTHGSGQV